jgi:hypothetical protein
MAAQSQAHAHAGQRSFLGPTIGKLSSAHTHRPLTNSDRDIGSAGYCRWFRAVLCAASRWITSRHLKAMVRQSDMRPTVKKIVHIYISVGPLPRGLCALFLLRLNKHSYVQQPPPDNSDRVIGGLRDGWMGGFRDGWMVGFANVDNAFG